MDAQLFRGAPLKPDQRWFDDIVVLLAGIGPDRIAAVLESFFGLMIWTAIHIHEGTDLKAKRDSNLRAVANQPALELLVTLWHFTLNGDAQGIRPISLAQLVERAIRDSLREPRTARMINDTIDVFGACVPTASILAALERNTEVLKKRASIKRSLMLAAEGLQTLGLVEMRRGTRGANQSVIAEIKLTNRGEAFIRTLLRHSISASADYHPLAEEMGVVQ